MLLSNV
jgi:hypothetical protein